MATTSLPPTAYVPVGSEFEQGRPLGSRVRFNGEGGVRRAWWWEAGPVDSFCFCCSLTAGMAVMALTDILYCGMYKLDGLMDGRERRVQVAAYHKDKYARECENVDEPAPDCVFQASVLLVFTATDDLFMTTLAQAMISMLFGLVGLWAVVTHNALAAKVYLGSWPPRFLVELMTVIIQYNRLEHYHMAYLWKMYLLGAFLDTAVVAYCAKVTWSYYLMLKRRKRAAESASDTAGGIELDESPGTTV